MNNTIIINQKGGVGKTTINIAIANYFNEIGKKILFIDSDQQGNATKFFLKNTEKKHNLTFFDLIIEKAPLNEVVINIENTNIDIVQAPLIKQNIITSIENAMRREALLAQALKNIKNYDFCILDLPPTLSILTANALLIADNVFIITTPDQFAIDGIESLINYFNDYKKIMEVDINFKGIILNLKNKSEKRVNEILYKHNINDNIITEIPKKSFIRKIENDKKIINFFQNNSNISIKNKDKKEFYDSIKKIIQIIIN